jgi:hypothetical protein
MRYVKVTEKKSNPGGDAMAQDKTAEVSEAEIAVHWQEEDYIRPPKTAASFRLA